MIDLPDINNFILSLTNQDFAIILIFMLLLGIFGWLVDLEIKIENIKKKNIEEKIFSTVFSKTVRMAHKAAPKPKKSGKRSGHARKH